MRSEQVIFDELTQLCASPGYIHAIAYLCFRDNMVFYSDEMKPEDMQRQFSKNRLIRTETSTLIGLMLKSEIDFALPLPKVLQEYISSTESLLEEFHHAIGEAFWKNMDPTKVADENFNPFMIGEVLREPIFYGGESAYSFQYRDFSPKKYAADNEWLVQNKGFSIQDATVVAASIGRFLDGKAATTLRSIRSTSPDLWTYLPCNIFSAMEISEHSGLLLELVENILSSFAIPSGTRNEQFVQLNDYNIANANPLLRDPDDNYILFDFYSMVEALYESPFYWMGADKHYVNTAMRNRGLFTEQFAVDRLSFVFGPANVYPNIDIYEAKGRKIAEIDVLVLFGNRALVLQAKSKRMTLEARRGNDLRIRDDFKKSIQDSCNQAYLCAGLLEDRQFTLTDANSRPIELPENIKRIYVLCLISDHYPALSFQARQFLSYTATETISPPFVLDVFALDAMTEMLDSPLQFLSYVDRRTGYTEKLLASHELTILSYHLKQNLWMDDEAGLVVLDDSISADLDLAMLVRRESIPGKSTPDGILTRFASTTLGQFVKDIERQPNPGTIDLGFTLLTLAEQTVLEVSAGIDHVVRLALNDGQSHDFTIGFGKGQTGLTIHCNNDPVEKAQRMLHRHCTLRKYSERTETWFGICVRPTDKSLRFGLNLEYKWEYNKVKEAAVAAMPKLPKLNTLLGTAISKKHKVGRNEPCPCGSGKKFKKCCLR